MEWRARLRQVSMRVGSRLRRWLRGVARKAEHVQCCRCPPRRSHQGAGTCPPQSAGGRAAPPSAPFFGVTLIFHPATPEGRICTKAHFAKPFDAETSAGEKRGLTDPQEGARSEHTFTPGYP
ncbi:hypothetical protein GN956_G24345 [Arapaima gigas]